MISIPYIKPMSRSRLRLSATALLILFITASFALEVSPNSPCASKCLDRNDGNPSWRNQSLTFNDMLPCYNWEYSGNNSTAAALKFASCQECQLKSGWQAIGDDYNEKDSEWFLFNNKGVVDWCIFGRFEYEENKNITSSSIYQRCGSNCSQIRSSIDYNIKSDPGGFDFCEYDTNANFTVDAEACRACLYANEDLTILGNVLTIVQDMCERKPGRNYTVPANVSVYAAERIQLSATSTSSLNTSSSTSSLLPDKPSTNFSKGAIAGVVLGALVAIILILGGILLLLRRKKNRSKSADVPKSEKIAAPMSLPQGYEYNSVPVHEGDRYEYAAEAPPNHAPVEMGVEEDTRELPAVSKPPDTRH